MENVRLFLGRWGVFLILTGWAGTGWGQIRVVTFNMLQEVRPKMTEVFAAIGSSARAGFAQPPDIVVLQESLGADTTAEQFANMLNGIYGEGAYARGSLTGVGAGTNTSGGPSVVYRTNRVSLISEEQVNQINSSGAARPTLRYQFRPSGYDSGSDFYVYNSHFKASFGPTNEARRSWEAQEIRANADALGAGLRAIYSGDLNVYSSAEPAIQSLIAAGTGQALDPVNRLGAWSLNAEFKDVHTQSPVTVGRFAGQVTGGMDDRFDFQLVTAAMMSGRGFAYIPGSYWAFGNTGTHLMDGEITSGSVAALLPYLPGYTEEQAAAVLTALAESSDHLPVVADYQLPARLAVTVTPPSARMIRGATVSLMASVSNAAVATVPAGADRLDFAWSGSGGLTGTGSGVAQPLGPAQAASFFWDTATAGVKTGTLTVTTESPQAFPASFSTNFTATVLEAAGASFASGTTTNSLTVDFGRIPRSGAASSRTFQVYNRVSGSGTNLTSNLNTDGVDDPAGGAGPFTVQLALATVRVGRAVTGTIYVSTSNPGYFEKIFPIRVSDENVPGEGSQTLALRVRATVGSTIESWSSNAPVTSELVGKYAVGGASSVSAASESPVMEAQANSLSLTAIVRKDDPRLAVGAEWATDLGAGWSGEGVSSATNGLAQPPDPGLERRKFTVPYDPANEPRKFLRLKATLAQ